MDNKKQSTVDSLDTTSGDNEKVGDCKVHFLLSHLIISR